MKRAINSARKILMGYVLRTYKGVMVIDHFISFDKKERKWELGIFLSSPHGWK
ncbi:MAG: hypothetical protein GTN76_04270 [Candidatus Aenigmarchaeota archaeon]|nr:hypothetical protein [Candidatus Aenigmarchaeota archaeon]